MTRFNTRTFWIIAATLAAIVSVSAAQMIGGPGTPGDAITTHAQIFSRVQLIEGDDGEVLRLDTQTGALMRFRGETGRNARGTFISVARPLREDTSGFLELQRAGRGTFLVDAVTGDAWILRQRGTNNAAWISLNVLGTDTP